MAQKQQPDNSTFASRRAARDTAGRDPRRRRARHSADEPLTYDVVHVPAPDRVRRISVGGDRA